MAGSKLVSRGTAYFAVISTLNLLIIMAAIANDGSMSNSTSVPTSATIPTFVQTSTPSSKPLPPISSLVRGPGYDTVIKVAAGGKDRIILPMPGVSGAGKPLPIRGNSTMSPLIDFINSSSTSPFTTHNWTEVKAQYKSNALLPCHVRNSGDGVTVSWIRRKDYHLLTVGLQTYSSDDRFQAIHAHSPDDWALKIKYVQPRDAGIYECQVSTHPPSSIFVTLSIVEVRAEIVGGPEKIYKAGSTVELKCELKVQAVEGGDLIDSTEAPEYLFWYQGLQMINYGNSGFRHINVTHYKSSSILILQNVQKSATGNYSCVPSNAHPSSIFVHIINGENPAAFQHGSSTTCVPCPPLWFLSFLLSLTLQALYFRFMSNHVDRYHERCTITSASPLSPLKQKLSSHASSPNQQCSRNHHHRHQLFHHNHHCHHLPSPCDAVGDISSCHRFSENDHNHPAPQNEDELMLATHYGCCCGESEKCCSIYTATAASAASPPRFNATAAVQRNQKSGTRSSVSSDSNFALCCRSEERQRSQFLPVTTHSSRLTVR